MATTNGSSASKAADSTLSLYFPQVQTLRQYLLQHVPRERKGFHKILRRAGQDLQDVDDSVLQNLTATSLPSSRTSWLGPFLDGIIVGSNALCEGQQAITISQELSELLSFSQNQAGSDGPVEDRGEHVSCTQSEVCRLSSERRII